jgi:hypothetical protein
VLRFGHSTIDSAKSWITVARRTMSAPRGAINVSPGTLNSRRAVIVETIMLLRPRRATDAIDHRVGSFLREVRFAVRADRSIRRK